MNKKYPHIESWVASGSIEIGSSDEYGYATARILDEGGTVWETDEDFPTLEATLDAIEQGLEEWFEKEEIE